MEGKTNFDPRISRMAAKTTPRLGVFLKLLAGCRVFPTSGAVGSRENQLNQQLMSL